MIRRWFCLLVCAALMMGCTGAMGEDQIRGYEKKQGWQFVQFGSYPYEKDGTEAPVLWRVLKLEDGRAFMMTENVIDFVLHHTEKDEDPEHPLAYADTLMCRFLNTECVDTLFTPEEKAALTEMEDGRGVLSCATFEELTDTSTGFPSGKGKNTRRNAWGTPYAYEKGLKKLGSNRCSWYFTATWRRLGFRWIVGDDGHISVVGADRVGGVRPVVYLDVSKVAIASGAGEREDPYILQAAP